MVEYKRQQQSERNTGMKRRIFLIVLDSVGIGAMEDAAEFGDAGCNTLRSASRSSRFRLTNMEKLGLFNIDGIDWKKGVEKPLASYGRMKEASRGKDTTIGHWEIPGSRFRYIPTDFRRRCLSPSGRGREEMFCVMRPIRERRS